MIIRCYFKDRKGLHRVDVGDVSSHSQAIAEVQDLIRQGAPMFTPTILAVVK